MKSTRELIGFSYSVEIILALIWGENPSMPCKLFHLFKTNKTKTSRPLWSIFVPQFHVEIKYSKSKDKSKLLIDTKLWAMVGPQALSLRNNNWFLKVIYMAAAAMIRVKPFASRWNFLNFLDFLRSKAGFLLRILLFYTVKPAGLYLTSTSAPCFSIPRSLYLTWTSSPCFSIPRFLYLTWTSAPCFFIT